MSKRYPGNFITGNPVALTQSSNNGVWDLKDQFQAQNTDTWQEASGIYAIPRSLRFRRSATAYLSKTMGVPTNNKIFTYSGWVKLALTSGGSYSLFSGHNTDENNELWLCWTSEKFILQQTVNGSGQAYASTNAVFRDPSAWYHVVVALDSTQAVPLNRIKLYVNGVQQTFASYSGLFLNTQNFTPWMNYSGAPHRIGQLAPPNNGAMDGYMAELNFVDGQQLDPSYFGYFDPITNIWQPKKYTGTYGNNGFYLPFTENQTTTNLARNFAGSNYKTYSQTFSDASWQKNNVTIGTAVTAPDGTTTAVTLTDNSTLGHHTVYGSSAVTAVSGATYTLSAYAKAGTHTIFGLWETNATGTWATYNLATGSVTGTAGGATANIQHVGNGWYRCSLTLTSAASLGIGLSTALSNTYPGTSYVGTGTNLFIWGAQINLGSTVDPYIPTVASAVNNDWTTNFISLTAGVTYDSMVDSPTNVFTSATDIGGTVPGNYCTWNSVDTSPSAALSSANLNITPGYSTQTLTRATMSIPSGAWYFEVTCTGEAGDSSAGEIGVSTSSALANDGGYLTWAANSIYYTGTTGNKNIFGTSTSYGATWGTGAVIGVAIDTTAGTIVFYKNGASQGTITNAGITPNTLFPIFANNSTSGSRNISANFGQRPFAYAPPAGFRSLNTTNIQTLGTSAVGKAAIQANKWMDISLYGGTATARNIVNSGFQPDLIWQKSRSDTTHHRLVDSVRGSNLELYSSLTNTEGNSGSDGIINFNNNGFSLGGGGGSNAAGTSYVAWQWKQSPTSGFNILSWTGTGVARSISHNLGVAPRFMLIKQRTVESRSWPIYHAALDNPQSAIYLDSQAASFAYTAFFNNQTPDSNSIYLGTDATVNQSGSTYIGYVWAEVPGFSKFGSFSGNGLSNGPFINTGFRPKFFMYKAFSHSSDWWLLDATRSSINVAGNYVFPNASTAEGVEGTWIDFLSNGIKIRGRTDPNTNGSDRKYIYMAFAESPFALNNRAR